MFTTKKYVLLVNLICLNTFLCGSNITNLIQTPYENRTEQRSTPTLDIHREKIDRAIKQHTETTSEIKRLKKNLLHYTSEHTAYSEGILAMDNTITRLRVIMKEDIQKQFNKEDSDLLEKCIKTHAIYVIKYVQLNKKIIQYNNTLTTAYAKRSRLEDEAIAEDVLFSQAKNLNQ